MRIIKKYFDSSGGIIYYKVESRSTIFGRLRQTSTTRMDVGAVMDYSYKDMRNKLEREYLSPFAFHSCDTAGRQKPIDPCDLRTDFQRDRDRIIHSKSFRRLMHKTQCFLSPEGDHYRTRLTHTLEVSQIGRSAARLLKLNEDLVEAACLGHDLGHTPFGHAGERVLDSLCPGGFSHNEQSIRTVTILERDGEGLNLTAEVLDGILCHTGPVAAKTLEGRLIKYADRIAYINHDIDDAIRAGILSDDMIPEKFSKVLGKNHSQRIDTMVKSLVAGTKENFENGIAELKMNAEVEEATDGLRGFMFEKVYINSEAKKEESKACELLAMIYRYFVKNPDKMPQDNKKFLNEYSTDRVVADYVAGMTDRYALEVYNALFVPKMWGK